MALVTPYCTIVEASTYLAGSTIWDDAETSAKNNALFWGRVYLDSNYSCTTFDATDPPDEIKFANALLAEDYLDGTLIETGSGINGNITKKRVKAGSVESETEYYPGASIGDAQDNVNSLLSSICKKIGSTKMIMRV